MSRTPRLARFLTPFLAAVALSAVTPEASACGGFFCGATPIDQTAEHILFTMNPDLTITVHVQIQYAGDRENFAWIIPVPTVPTLAADFPGLAFQGLDMATQPQYFKNDCYGGGRGGPGFATGGAPPPSVEDGGVTVIARQDVGPYSTVTLEGTSAAEIVGWLQANGFRITDQMIPFIQPYVADGMKFVAMVLQPDQDVSDIKPLSMTYFGDKPMIPIRLTTVAAQPEMGLVTFVMSDRRYAPDNYVDLEIPDRLIEFDQYGYQNNYLKLVSQEADKVGGQAFVTEYAKPTGELLQTLRDQFVNPDIPDAVASRDTLIGLLERFPYLTRLYARMSAEEMNLDPTFIEASDTSEVDNVHDLTPPGFDPTLCNYNQPPPQPPPTDPCFLTYCGRSGVCAGTSVMVPGATVAQDMPACVCAGDATARVTTTTNGQPSMYCEPVRMNLDSSEPGGAGSAPLFQVACEGFSCGAHGECIGMNGNPTCRCEPGYGAVSRQEYDGTTGTASTVVTCERVAAVPPMPVLPKIGQPYLRQTRDEDGPSASGGCSVARRTAGGTFAFAMTFLGLAGMSAARRRRR